MDEISQTLQGSLSADPNARRCDRYARPVINTRVTETGLALASLTVNQQADPTIRQAAGVVLRKYVTEHWSPYFSQFKGSAPSAEIKVQIRHTIFQGLSDPNRKIRTAAAYIVSTVAHSDWPDEYPDLLDNLVAALAVSPDAVHGSLQVFTEFMKNDLTEDQLMPVLRQLMPALLNILGQPQLHSAATRARTVVVFRQCVVSLIMLKEQYPDATKEASSNVLPVWLDAFKVLLEVDPRLDVADASNWDGLSLKIQIFKSLNTIVGSFPKTLEPHLHAFINAATTHLVSLAPLYATYYLSADGPSPPVSEEDPEGITIPALVAPLLDFLSNLVRKGRLAEWIARPENVQALVGSVVSWAQITTEEEGKWEDSPNTFVAEDDDDANADNLRAAAFELISHLVDSVAAPTVAALNVATTSIVAESNAAKQAGSAIWWKHLEALLAVLGAAADELYEHKDAFDFGRLFNDVIPALLSLPDTPFLSGRAFVFASRLTQALPSNLSTQYLTAAADVLEGGGGVVIKISAVKAIRNFCDKIKDPAVVALAPRLVKNLGPFLAASEDTLSLVVETLVTVLSLENGSWLTPDLTAMLSNALLDVWAKNVKDPILLSVLEDAFIALAKAQYQAALTSSLSRLCATLVEARVEESWVASSALQLVIALLQGAPAEGGLGDGVFAQLAPGLFGALERIDDRDVLQNGIVCLTQVVRKDCAQVLAYPDGLQLVLRLIARTLAPVDSESGGMFVGDLILSLLRRAGPALLPNMPELLNALLNRLPTAKTPTFIQSLILPFAYLIYTQRDAVLEMLETSRLADGRSGLQVLLEAWCENGETFIGFKATRLSNLALSSLFASERPSLQSLAVKGDLIVKPETSNDLLGPGAKGFEDDDFAADNDDDDFRDDPIASIDMKARLCPLAHDKSLPLFRCSSLQEHLISFLKECAARNTNNFAAVVDQLKVEEAVVVRAAISS
ncbi:ARM repeat-containing protein [Exidia glandulosa HHB12029]|uniref:ARM repeat-containing protein n=1 Tax=Exidia glandulosa HHB12029 TaxID=1314781 RepID=A0A165ZAZ9_EXIGL|nr:ARM repeat-containing protein [Exidia glandulosa HHB12029]